MGKYNTFTQKPLSKKNQPRESWRYIGCLIMLIVPLISIFAGPATVDWMIKMNVGYIPYAWMGYAPMPAFIANSSALRMIFSGFFGIENLYAKAVASIIFMLVIGSLISVSYSIVYGLVGPDQYGPTDAPPSDVKVTKKSR